jgi:hypothetical protein
MVFGSAQHTQSFEQTVGRGLDLGAVLAYQPLKQGLATRTEMYDYLPTIEVVCRAHDEAPALGAVNQLDGAVMCKLEPLGEAADLGWLARGQAADSQQELILLRMKVGAPRCFLAEAQKPAYLITKFCLRHKLGVERCGVASFMSCHDIHLNAASLPGQKTPC